MLKKTFTLDRWLKVSALGATVLALVSIAGHARAAEPASCLSPNPSDWPAPSKPYFMVIVDTSGSMVTDVGSTNSCGYNTTGTNGAHSARIDHARCAVRNTINAYAGEVNFGLATYAWKLQGCPNGTCASPQYAGCGASFTPGDDSFCGPLVNDPAISTALNDSNPGTHLIHAGGLVAVPVVQDNFWTTPTNASNAGTILGLVDNNCTASNEIGAGSNTPLGGALFNMNQYFSGTYRDPFAANYPNNAALASPIGPATFGGVPAERACRPINVILITDGDETCDAYNDGVYPCPNNNTKCEGLAVFEAGRLLSPGVTVNTLNFSVKTYVIGFAGATKTSLDHIAAAGGTGTSFSTVNETDISNALTQIVTSAIKPETCDNVDNNCNGCTDEGSIHYCDKSQTCCAWATDAARTTCLNTFNASIGGAFPNGDPTKLPCTTVAQAQDPAHWLCFNPGDQCDNIDNNCEESNGVGTVDEGALKCGSPLHCPSPEICDGQDNDCNGLVDEGAVCGTCAYQPPQQETCDGCDQNCNGTADDGVATSTCGLSGPGEPPNCAGILTCIPQAVGTPGACVTPKTSCSATPQAEICDGLDNNCDGIIDNNVPSVPCVPAGTPAGLNYGANSQCKMGQTQCVNGVSQCVGFVGPSAEVCDGIDNDCNGVVDNGVPGTGQSCGINQPPCTPGLTACVNGTLVCQGGIKPQPEICDGIDNNCNGQIDEAPLTDGPAPGMNGCWDLPGACCSFHGLSWCPPTGGTCNGLGSLTMPCNTGNLVCAGGGWKCTAATDPSPEVCDGIDNNCNGVIDDGVMNVGTACGSNVGECKPGLLQCTAGMITCVGATGPTMEICDGLDNDCDGVIDNGVQAGAPCAMAYDTTMYPGDRTKGACKPGVLQCDMMGGTICVGGVGPSPEVCDGIDNDCDGQIDEVGMPPDGIDGTANPTGNPMANIGDACGKTGGSCTQGTYACVNGAFACLGGMQGQPEQCNCKDDDCDGVVDNPNPNGPPLCGTGKSCVKGTNGCQCAAPCGGEIPCPPGQMCEAVTDPANGMSLGNFCTQDYCAGGCAKKTVTDTMGDVVCAPDGSLPNANCVTPPVCECKGQSGCQNPCNGVTCPSGSVCTDYGPNAGTCVVDNCYNVPCNGCDKACNLGGCVPNPCGVPNACPTGKECKPSADFVTAVCVDSCADVTCTSGKTCEDGVCVSTCSPACGAGEVCDETQTPPACVMNACLMMSPDAGSGPIQCSDGSYCDPLTGQCGKNPPCDGVICPTDQVCDPTTNQCSKPVMMTTTSSSGTSMSNTGAGAGTTTSVTGATGTGTGTGGAPNNGVFGLPTGGGGCSIDAGSNDKSSDAALFFAALALAIGARRKRSERRGDEEVSS